MSQFIIISFFCLISFVLFVEQVQQFFGINGSNSTEIMPVVFFIWLLIIPILLFVLSESKKEKRLSFIQSYQIPLPILKRFQAYYPELTGEQVQMVIDALKIYFKCFLQERKFTAMPSKVVDMLWHEFILNTHEYETFCQHAFGSLLHHTPAEMLSPSNQIISAKMQKGLKVVWRFSCKEESINSFTPHKLPMLFAIDAKLAIKDSVNYILENCAKKWGEEPYSCGGCC